MARGHTAPWCSVRLRLLGANWQEFTQVGRHPTVPHRGLLRAVAAYLDRRPKEPVPVVPVGADDVPAMVLDPSLTQKAFGWRAKVTFRELMRAQLDWYAAHGVSEIHSHLHAR